MSAMFGMAPNQPTKKLRIHLTDFLKQTLKRYARLLRHSPLGFSHPKRTLPRKR